MPWLKPDKYKRLRESFSYTAPNVKFIIRQTGRLGNVGIFYGVYPKRVPENRPNGVNLRRFELICQEVFNDCLDNKRSGSLTSKQVENLKDISCAIVHWKMASQGGRAKINEDRVRSKWEDKITVNQLLRAYTEKDISLFKISGVRIPTASAFLRILYPKSFGIIDKHVATLLQKNRIINMNLRQEDHYIIDTANNEKEYRKGYIPKLRKEAKTLNDLGVTFSDIDPNGNEIQSIFRACDIEMALFSISEPSCK